jgi:ABC-type uncharacterized transport system ATPase subunit
MSKPRTFIPKVIRQELDATGLEWVVEVGGRHQHIRLAGRLVSILPICGADENGGRAMKNVIAGIRRRAKEIKDGSQH